MLDAAMRKLVDPSFTRAGRLVARTGLSANHWTLIGLGFGVGAAVLAGFGAFGWALAFLAINRLLDGLDGAVARATRPTEFGGYLDIVADFIVWALLPLGFALADPANALAAALLLASFIGTGSTFLAHAILAAKAGATSAARGQKSFFHMGGLVEGTETIFFFGTVLAFPGLFPWFAPLFALACAVTTLGRILETRAQFG